MSFPLALGLSFLPALIATARAGAWQRWLLYGAGLLLLGVFTGVVTSPNTLSR